MEKLIRNELSCWKRHELIWLAAACTIITALSLYWGDPPLGIISSVSGVACMVCTGKGKLSAYAFGLVNSVLYAVISYRAALYGETMLNALYYVPMQFVGFYVWYRHMDQETGEVVKKRMKPLGFAFMCGAIAAATFLCGGAISAAAATTWRHC